MTLPLKMEKGHQNWILKQWKGKSILASHVDLLTDMVLHCVKSDRQNIDWVTVKTLIGSQRSFGALSFKAPAQLYIRLCGEVIPQPKKWNVLPDDPENDKTGFQEATDDPTKSMKEKGKVVVTNVIDAEDDILEISDIDDIELIHFESDLIDDPELESHYFEACGMTDI